MLKNFWYVAGTSRELGGDPVARTIVGTPIVLFRTEDTRPAALKNYCSHRRAPLSLGRIVSDTIECPYHGMRFAADGRCVLIPSQTDIPDRAHVTALPVVERHGLIWVWPGDRGKADPSLVPALPWRDDPAWNSGTVHHYHVKGNHVLMTDNLLDLGHVAFIHADTIGFEPEGLKEDPLEIKFEGDRIVSKRKFTDVKPSPAVATWGNFPGLIDRTSVSTWYPPCFTSIAFSNQDANTALQLRIDHFITPETDRTHNYWVAVSRDFQVDDERFTGQMQADNDRVHQQDLLIVEEQQKMMDLVPDYRDMPLRQDRAITIAHRTLARLAAAEAGPGEMVA